MPSRGSFNCPAESFPLPKTTVSLGPATLKEDQHPGVHGRPIVINGIAVFPYTAASYIVPSLRVEISVGGVLGQRVLHTLTRSPRSVALAKGPAPRVPSSWSSVTFAGLRFSVPAFWPIQRTSGAAFGLGSPCATPGVAFPDNTAGLLSSGVTLSTDLHLLPPASCPAETDPDAPQPPMDGVQVDSGRLAQFHVSLSFSAPCPDLHGLTACPASSPGYSILVLRVAVPGRSKPVFVSIGLAGTKQVFKSLGLAGNGVVARTILYSLRAVPTRTRAVSTGTTLARAAGVEGSRLDGPGWRDGGSNDDDLGHAHAELPSAGGPATSSTRALGSGW